MIKEYFYFILYLDFLDLIVNCTLLKVRYKTMKTLLISILLVFAGNLHAQKYSKVKLYTGSEGLQYLAELGLAVDHGTMKRDVYFITDLSEYEIHILDSVGFNYEILIDDVQKFYVNQNKNPEKIEKNLSCPTSQNGAFDPIVPSNFDVMATYGGFYKYNEMLAELDAMAAQYPNLITVKSPISTFTTIEGRPIYHVKISDNPNTNEAEPEVLYTAIHHAREPLSMSATIFYMWYLLENYGTDPEVTFLVDNTQMYFVPCINVDGYLENESTDPNGGGMHRKNKRNVGTYNKGVDLNRNYSYGWNTTGVSSNVNNDTYPGTVAFSEPETQAMQWLHENHTFVSALNAHTYGNTLLFPIGTTTAELSDHHDYFVDLSGYMCSQNGFFPQKSSGLYPASGDSDDYAYKVDIGVGLKDTVFAMTPEIGSSFWPASNQIIPSCKDMVLPNLMLSHLTHKFLVVKEDDPTMIATLTGSFHHTVQRLGLEDGAVTVTLVPLLNIQSLGAGVVYNLNLRAVDDGLIAFNLNPSIQFGDEVKYIIEKDYGVWIDRDTITKTFGAITEQFADNADNAMNWIGSWGTTSSTYYSASKSFADSPTGNYSNNANKTFELNQTIDLTYATAAGASFYAKWKIEADYDFVQFQVSTDDGASWIAQCGLYTVPGAGMGVQASGKPVWEGIQTSWVREEINLSDYLGETIKVRFQLRSDGGSTDDGFYFDDFSLAYNATTSANVKDLKLTDIELFPNPTNGEFELTGLEVGSMVTIVDAAGKSVYSSKASNEKMTVELKNCKAGTYYVKTTKGGELIEKPFVLLK